MTFGHTPIMLDACIQFLAIRPGGTYVDMTLGGAGHAYRADALAFEINGQAAAEGHEARALQQALAHGR